MNKDTTNKLNNWQRFRKSLPARLYTRHQGALITEKMGGNQRSLTKYFSFENEHSPSFDRVIKFLNALAELKVTNAKETQLKALNWICKQFGYKPVPVHKFTEAELSHNGNELLLQVCTTTEDIGNIGATVRRAIENDGKIDVQENLEIAAKMQTAGNGLLILADQRFAKAELLQQKNTKPTV